MAISLYWTPTISAIGEGGCTHDRRHDLVRRWRPLPQQLRQIRPCSPSFFISGIVTEPVVTVFPTELPDTIPQRAEEMTATLAGPPVEAPARELANWIKNSEIPVASRNAPNRINSAIYVEQTPMGVPMTPLVV